MLPLSIESIRHISCTDNFLQNKPLRVPCVKHQDPQSVTAFRTAFPLFPLSRRSISLSKFETDKEHSSPHFGTWKSQAESTLFATDPSSKSIANSPSSREIDVPAKLTSHIISTSSIEKFISSQV